MDGKRLYRLALVAIAAFAIVLALLSRSGMPEVVLLPEHLHAAACVLRKLKDIHIILPDDVMVTMRVSKFFLAHGYPGFNLTDLSQPATSYLWPILLSPFFV
jgi:hypothetical protein